jgi:tRNA (cytidine/uridine-2'-O-)-methyltransferase
MISIALYKPDIPQNTAAIVRFCACFGVSLHIIEPCTFNLDDKRFKRVVMDYQKICQIFRYEDYSDFKNKNARCRIILMTTKSKKTYYKFKFSKNDILLFGKESSGVPQEIHNRVSERLKIPMIKTARSLNIVSAVSISVSEAIRQNYHH